MRISEPDHLDSEELRQLFQRLRGSAVSSFAEAEFAMGDLIGAMEVSGSEPDVVFSMKVEKRLNAFREVCFFHAGDDKIRERVERATSSFEAVINDRNALVHGCAKLFPKKRCVEVLRFEPTKEYKHSVIRHVYELDLLEDRVREFDYICRNIMALSWLLARKLDLLNGVKVPFQVALTD